MLTLDVMGQRLSSLPQERYYWRRDNLEWRKWKVTEADSPEGYSRTASEFCMQDHGPACSNPALLYKWERARSKNPPTIPLAQR